MKAVSFMLALILVIKGFPGGVASVITGPTTDNPCQLDLTSTGNVEFLPLPAQISETITTINLAQYKVQNLISAFIGNYLTHDEVNMLDKEFQNNPLSLPLVVEDVAANDSSRIEFMMMAYTHISTYIVHFKLAQVQVASDSGSGSVLVSEVNEILKTFFDLLCRVDTAIRSQSGLVSQFANSSSVEVPLEGIDSTKMRYYWDFLLASSAKSYLASLSMTYISLY